MPSPSSEHRFPAVTHPTLAEALGDALHVALSADSLDHPALAEAAFELDAAAMEIWLSDGEGGLVRTAGWPAEGGISGPGNHWSPPADHPIHTVLGGHDDVASWHRPAHDGVPDGYACAAPIVSLDGIGGLLVMWRAVGRECTDTERSHFLALATMLGQVRRSGERRELLTSREWLDDALETTARTLLNRRPGDPETGLQEAVSRIGTDLDMDQLVFYRIDHKGAPRCEMSWVRSGLILPPERRVSFVDPFLADLGELLLTTEPVIAELEELSPRARHIIEVNGHDEGPVIVIPIVVDGRQTGGLALTIPARERWLQRYGTSLTSFALAMHFFVERCHHDEFLVAESRAAELLGRLSSSLWEFTSLEDAHELEPHLTAIAGHLGADVLVLSAREGDHLRQLTGSPIEGLEPCVERWDVLIDEGRYAWSPTDRAGQATAFGADTHGLVLSIGHGAEIAATLTVVSSEGPLAARHELVIIRLQSMLRGLVRRLASESELRRQRELEALRSFVGARYLEVPPGVHTTREATGDVLGRIAAAFGADEVIWGNRFDPETDTGGVRFRSDDGWIGSLPPTRLRLTGPQLDGSEPVVHGELSDSAVEHLGHDLEEIQGIHATITVTTVRDLPVGGLGLLDYGSARDRPAADLECLLDLTRLIHQFETGIQARRAIDELHSYDELGLEVAHYLLDAARSAESVDEVNQWTLERVGKAFGAEFVMFQDSGTEIHGRWPFWAEARGRERTRRLEKIDREALIRQDFRQHVGTDRSALMRFADFSPESQGFLLEVDSPGFTSVGAIVSDDERRALIGASAFTPRNWGDAERSALLGIGTQLQQATDAIRSRQAMGTHSAMEELVSRCAAALIEEDDLAEALSRVLSDIARTLDAKGAAWLEVQDQARRVDVYHAYRADGTSLPVPSLAFDVDEWEEGTAAR